MFTAAGLVTLAGAAGGWLAFLPPDQLYLLGSLLIVIGTVIQDVVADAMSTEVVARVDATGDPKPDPEVRSELGMVQVLGRLSLSAGVLAVAGLSGVLAGWFSRETVFLMGLVIPLISLIGVFMIAEEKSEPRPIDWRILGGGLVFGAAVLALALGGVPYSAGNHLPDLDGRDLRHAGLRHARSRTQVADGDPLYHASSSSRFVRRPRSATAISGGRSTS